jgi:hypothetical protein
VPDAYSRIAAAYAACDPHLITAVDLLPARNANSVRFRLTLSDGSRLHVSEEWRQGSLNAYSYYWLDVDDALIQGWDNAPHHPHLDNYPHHTHIGSSSERQPSYATTLEDVLAIIESRLRNAGPTPVADSK